jgi:hypothetical protein
MSSNVFQRHRVRGPLAMKRRHNTHAPKVRIKSLNEKAENHAIFAKKESQLGRCGFMLLA